MGQPVVHFEIIGADLPRLGRYFGELFGWEFDTSTSVSQAISRPDDYGFVTAATAGEAVGIPGGVGGGDGYDAHVIFYVGVPDVEDALQKAESLGGSRVIGPDRAPTGPVVGQFTDPEGHLIGVAEIP
jgi:predicted enzyme related to lactoylglutathione lyase